MKDLLSKIYDYVVNYEDDSIKLGSKFDVEVKKAIEPLKESMTAEEWSVLKESCIRQLIPQKRMDFIWESAQLSLCLWKQCCYQMTLTSHKTVKYEERRLVLCVSRIWLM